MKDTAHINAESEFRPQPFLKWAGGKRALLGEIRIRKPEFTGRYIEPFLGAGAVFFDQPHQMRKVVSDFNGDLIEVYEVIRDNLVELIEALSGHANTKEHYYTVRAWDRDSNWRSATKKVERAARFIFLNKTTYNGLYRVNASGQMNVPYGGQKNPDWIQSALLRKVSAFLNTRALDDKLTTTLLTGDYRDALSEATQEDWVYLDPPYAQSFSSYQSAGFTTSDHLTLRDEILRLSDLGVPVLLSNSDVPFIHEIYGNHEVFKIETVSVRRAIGSKVSSRVQVTEVLISNYKYVGARLG